METALIGESKDRPDDPYFLTAASPVDQLVLSGPVAQECLEDLQMWSCLQALCVRGALIHPVETQVGNDPPDRIWRSRGESYAVEMTELTMSELRANLSRIRHVGRLVTELVNEESDKFTHLTDRAVQISSLTNQGLPARCDFNRIVNDIGDALREDKGYFDGGLTADQVAEHGMPDQLDITRGNYGEIHGLYVQVNHFPRTDPLPIPVIATSQADFYLSEARTIIRQRVSAKDDQRNKILLITTGLPDKTGYMCPLDKWLFDALGEHGLGTPLTPKFLDAVVLHKFGTLEIAQVYRRANVELPFLPATPRG